MEGNIEEVFEMQGDNLSAGLLDLFFGSRFLAKGYYLQEICAEYGKYAIFCSGAAGHT